jgi:hypothetical protein
VECGHTSAHPGRNNQDQDTEMNNNNCEACGASLAVKRADARWCSSACRMRAKRRESRLGALRELHGGRAELVGVHPDESDERFRSLLAASKAAEIDRAARAVIEREWSIYERRHGTEHPGRTADRVQRQAVGDAARAPRFTTLTPGEMGRLNRRAPVPAYAPGRVEWDDNDPDMMESPQMIDSPFRSPRRRH